MRTTRWFATTKKGEALDDAESGADVAAGLGHALDEPLAHFIRQLLQLGGREGFDVFGTADFLENQFGLVTM